MKNRLTGVVIGQLIGLVIVCCMSTFIALTTFGGFAGVGMANYSEQVFSYTAPFTCPGGTVDYEEYSASYNRPGEKSFYVECVAPDGTREDITGAALGYSILGFYLACFLPFCLPGGFLALVIPLFFLRGKKKEEAIPSL